VPNDNNIEPADKLHLHSTYDCSFGGSSADDPKLRDVYKQHKNPNLNQSAGVRYVWCKDVARGQ
jgi:hypothetical protein